MKRVKLSIPWREGLHLRPAAMLAKSAMSFQSSISLKFNERIADARSIMAIALLCASFGSVVDIEVSGPDEDRAITAVTSIFQQAVNDLPENIEIVDDRERPGK